MFGRIAQRYVCRRGEFNASCLPSSTMLFWLPLEPRSKFCADAQRNLLCRDPPVQYQLGLTQLPRATVPPLPEAQRWAWHQSTSGRSTRQRRGTSKLRGHAETIELAGNADGGVNSRHAEDQSLLNGTEWG
jgi:hypothetical protein